MILNFSLIKRAMLYTILGLNMAISMIFFEDQSEFAFLELSGGSLDINFVSIPGAA